MAERIYIDSFATVGRRGRKDAETEYRTEALLEEMEWCGIHGAFIAHAVAREYDPMFGNRMLLHELKKGGDRLHGVWTVMPHHTREAPPPDAMVKEMVDHGISVAKMYPRVHRYPFNLDYCGELLGSLERNGILLMVEGGHLYNPDILEASNQVLLSELDAVLTTFPGLNVLLQASRWDATRHLTWLMKKHANLHLELSNHQGNRAIELFAEWFGPDRILFGTGALDRSPGAAKAFVDYCTLGEEAKGMIASGNLMRLTGLVTPPPAYRSRPSKDPILSRARRGLPLDKMLVIDAHAHIAHEGAEGVGFIHAPYSDARNMVERAKLMGIDQMCISSFLAIWVDYVKGNEITVEAMKAYPRFYRGYASFDPTYITDWPKEFRRWYGRYGMEGMKPYNPRTGIPYNDKVWAPWYEYGNRMRAYALIHPSPNVVAEVNDLASKYPDITFIIAHCGASFADARLGIEMALRNPNVVLEITLTSVTYRVIEFMVKYVGADRVLFGTDQPMRDPIPQFGWMAYSHCTPAEKRKMFGLNMQKIIKRVRR
jgi:predicted TIM-barrel fold metal-dependent hydrolase